MSIPKLVLPKNRLELDKSVGKIHAIRNSVATSVYLIAKRSLRELADFRNSQVVAGGAEGPYVVDLVVFHSWELGDDLGTLIDLSVGLGLGLLKPAAEGGEPATKPKKLPFTLGFSYTAPIIVLLPGKGGDQRNEMREYINTGFRTISFSRVTSKEIVLQGKFAEETEV